EGITRLLAGREPSPPPTNVAGFLVYALLFGIVALQLRGMALSALALRCGRLRGGRLGARLRIGLSLASNLGWALLVLVLVPKQLGLGLPTLAQGLPDLVYVLGASGVVALGWSIVRTAWAYAVLRRARRSGLTLRAATT